MVDHLQIRVHGSRGLPTLVYLPGLHGDWTLVGSFRAAVRDRVQFVEFTYPRTRTWSLDEYAASIAETLLSRDIRAGWLLAESFGSQIAWPLMGRQDFQTQGLILAGGFVRHPWPWVVRQSEQLCGEVSMTWLTRFLYCYAKYARFRHRRAPETLSGIDEFLARRTDLDRLAAQHRLRLIRSSDLRPIARQTTRPVYSLAGLVDPIVPTRPVRSWLRQYCPGYRGGRTIWHADHNVLGTGPKAAADQVLDWITHDNESPEQIDALGAKPGVVAS